MEQYLRKLTHQSHVAALGAWITVLALAVDPLTQQLIHPVMCHRNTTRSLARISRANNMTFMGFPGGPDVMLETGMSGAIQYGLMNSSASVEYECSTGNCTFPANEQTAAVHQTIGFESMCVDVSREIRNISLSAWEMPIMGNRTYAAPSPISWAYTHTGYSANFSRYWPEKSSPVATFRFLPFMLTLDKDCKEQVEVPPGSDNPCLSAFAAECCLWPAVYTLSSQIDQSKLQEKIISSQPLNASSSGTWFYRAPEVLRNGTWEPCTSSTIYTPDKPVLIRNSAIASTGSRRSLPSSEWYAEDCVFIMDFYTSQAIRTYLSRVFQQKSLSGPYGVRHAYQSSGEVWLKNLWHGGNATISTVNTFTKQLASSMTTYARNNPARNQAYAYAQGIAVKTETCIQVQWAWIAFPASLVMLTIAFLGLAMWKTARHELLWSKGVWKSSSLAVLFAGLDDNVRQTCGRLDRRSEMVDCAEELDVFFSLSQEGWRLDSR